MSINVPNLKPNRIYANETDYGTSAASFIWKKMINNQNWVEKNIPIGFVLYFYASQVYPGGGVIAKPNPQIWVECDGRLISDARSPLNGQNAPDLTNWFLKGSSAIGNTGGQNTVNLTHNHGGQTGVTDDRHPIDEADTGNDYNTGSPHTHSIGSNLTSSEPVIPPFVGLQMYMRYK